MSSRTTVRSTRAKHLSEFTRFYFADLYIQVEDTLFKVNRRDFEEGSEVWRTMFELPSGERRPEGECREKPLVLEGVTVTEMEHFLAAVYPPPSQGEDTPETPAPIDHWRVVLKLAKMWNFAALTSQSTKQLRALTAADPLAMLALHAEFDDAEQWLVPALAQLVERRADLTLDEATQLGIEAAMKVCTLRGEHRAATGGRAQKGVVEKRIRQLWNLSSGPRCEPSAKPASPCHTLSTLFSPIYAPTSPSFTPTTPPWHYGLFNATSPSYY